MPKKIYKQLKESLKHISKREDYKWFRVERKEDNNFITYIITLTTRGKQK